jgi:hypothetical protein
MDATLGAVAVNYLSPKLGGEMSNFGSGFQVAKIEAPAHGNSHEP